jgi:hypothetical protein
MLHHNNATFHASPSVKRISVKKITSDLEQPWYSFDLAPCNFVLLTKLEISLEFYNFMSLEYICITSLAVLK